MFTLSRFALVIARPSAKAFQLISILALVFAGCSKSKDTTSLDAGQPSDTDAMTDITITTGLAVSNPTARACDVVLVAPYDSRILDVAFAATTRGRQQSRPPRTAISFISVQDVPFAGTLVDVNLVVESTGSEAAFPSLESARCYDREGKPIGDPGITIQ